MSQFTYLFYLIDLLFSQLLKTHEEEFQRWAEDVVLDSTFGFYAYTQFISLAIVRFFFFFFFFFSYSNFLYRFALNWEIFSHLFQLLRLLNQTLFNKCTSTGGKIIEEKEKPKIIR